VRNRDGRNRFVDPPEEKQRRSAQRHERGRAQHSGEGKQHRSRHNERGRAWEMKHNKEKRRGKPGTTQT
jgi:hypothetical protein